MATKTPEYPRTPEDANPPRKGVTPAVADEEMANHPDDRDDPRLRQTPASPPPSGGGPETPLPGSDDGPPQRFFTGGATYDEKRAWAEEHGEKPLPLAGEDDEPRDKERLETKVKADDKDKDKDDKDDKNKAPKADKPKDKP